VWSVWSEPLNLYLGTGFALWQRGRGQAQPVQFAATLPLDRVLSKLAEAASLSNNRPWKLRLWLSGALCPPIAFAVPKGIGRWSEMQALAEAAASAYWGQSPGGLRCEMAPQFPGMAAAVPSTLLAQVQQWALAHGGRLQAAQPLWACASQCPAARNRVVRALALHEPDSTTLLGQDAKGQACASALTAEIDAAGRNTSQRHWMTAHGFNDGQQVLTLRFDLGPTRKTTAAGGLPTAWASHWVRP
jgi:hypothetical protein